MLDWPALTGLPWLPAVAGCVYVTLQGHVSEAVPALLRLQVQKQQPRRPNGT